MFNFRKPKKRQAAADHWPQAKDVTELKSVLVVSPSLNEDDIRAYLQNRRESGGGPVDRVQPLDLWTYVVLFHTHQDAVNAVSRQTHEIRGWLLSVFLFDEQSGSVYSGRNALHWEQGFRGRQTVDIPRVDPQAPDTVLVTGVLPFFTTDSIKAHIERLGTGTHAVKSVRYVEHLRLAFVVFDDPNGARTVADKGTCKLTDWDGATQSVHLFLYQGTLRQHADVTHTTSTPGVQQASAARQDLIQQAVEAQLQAERELMERRVQEDMERRLEENVECILQDLNSQLEARLLAERRDLERKLLSQVKTEMEVFLRAEVHQPLAQVMNHMTQLQDGFTRIQEQVIHLQEQATHVQEQVTHVQEQVTETQNQVSELQDQVGAQTSQLKRDIDQTRSDLRAEVEQKVDCDVTQLRNHVARLQTELKNMLREEVGGATSELRSEAMDLENQTTQALEQLNQRVTELQTSLDTQGRMQAGMIGEVGRQARDEVTNLTGRIRGLNAQVHDVQERLNHLARAACGPHHLFVDNPSDDGSGDSPL